ncbi:MCP four helix bundle domain-containing protein [Flavobacterium algicola]|uniref:MCP four helix bundle domain-containing protein n=1 Tax=Flavobacterium algicola TaxID=556529 RepID=UPI001EFCBB5B|nr:MCP four helix bundle domain-containing protein [Flavobacterium algicola]MCG9791815.1 MCP four helix bundle domain-containing protein [Flavobacterium algicola]
MKDLNSLNKKSKAAMVLIFVSILLLLSNYFIGQNSKKTNESIKAIYNDRLMVSHYIFQYNNTIHKIKNTALQTNIDNDVKRNEIAQRLENIAILDKKYLATVLTAEEKQHFNTFQNQSKILKKLTDNNQWVQLTTSINQSLHTLTLLSQVQIDEGKTELTTANTLHSGNQIFAQFEVGLLIVLACLSVYLLVLKKMKFKIKIPEAPSMN